MQLYREMEDLVTETNALPIAELFNQVIRQANSLGASDIHIEPIKADYRIRFRIDGLLQTQINITGSVGLKLVAAIKLKSELDVAEKRKPQDGRLHHEFGQHAVEYRVSSLNTVSGEKLVLRQTNESAALPLLQELGLAQSQYKLISSKLRSPQGMILVTGPTGAGKSFTLYSALNEINHEGLNISTVEDPVELDIDGVNQVQINKKAGVDFAVSLKAFLRQDPDVIMVGEIRDLETAEIAIMAAQTGHLILTTLHTNSALEAIVRMQNIGISNFNLINSLSLVIAQRLLRVLCVHCKSPDPKQYPNINEEVFQAVGCSNCNGGYKGRVAIFECVEFDQTVAELIHCNSSQSELHQYCFKENWTLYQAGLAKVKAGITSMAELHRVLICE